MKSRIGRIGLSLCAAVIILIFTGEMHAMAAKNETEQCLIYVTGYEVSNETIIPGEDFTLTLKLANFSKTMDAYNVFVSVNNPEGVTPVYGTVSQTYLETVAAGEEVQVTFDYNSWTSIQAVALNFNVNLYDGTTAGTTQLRIPVGRISDFDVEDITVPLVYEENKTEYVSARIVNMDSKGVTNVVMVVRCNGEDIASTGIGTMSAGKTKTQSVSVTFAKAGNYALDLVLTYVDGDGNSKEYTVASESVKVVAENKQPIEQGAISEEANQAVQQSVTQQESRTERIIVICVSGILLIAISCILLLLIQKRK